MRIHPTAIEGLLVLELNMHEDERGFFMETWRDSWAGKLKLPRPFIQDNTARSNAPGVVRGLHFQAPPAAQAKLVWATSGAVFDVAVDIRKGSPTYGQWHGLVLSRSNRLRFFVPEGFAHGYMTLEPDTEIQYKVNAYYSPEHEGGLRFDDPAPAVAWPGLKPVVAERDRAYPLMEAFQSPFEYRKKR